MFSICDVLLINKIDVPPYFDFDMEACMERARKINPDIKIIPVSARNGEGLEEWQSGCGSRSGREGVVVFA